MTRLAARPENLSRFGAGIRASTAGSRPSTLRPTSPAPVPGPLSRRRRHPLRPVPVARETVFPPDDRRAEQPIRRNFTHRPAAASGCRRTQIPRSAKCTPPSTAPFPSHTAVRRRLDPGNKPGWARRLASLIGGSARPAGQSWSRPGRLNPGESPSLPIGIAASSAGSPSCPPEGAHRRAVRQSVRGKLSGRDHCAKMVPPLRDSVTRRRYRSPSTEMMPMAPADDLPRRSLRSSKPGRSLLSS